MAFFFSGRGLGASGAVKSVVVSAVDIVAPEHTANSEYYSKYVGEGKAPMKSWLVFEMIGVLVGGFLSGALSGRLNWKIEHFPGITANRRLIFAAMGGILFGFGSQLGRGCTSGSALSGMASLSVAGFVSMMAIFGTAFVLAYFFRKNWI
jgi:hypothetical protein